MSTVYMSLNSHFFFPPSPSPPTFLQYIYLKHGDACLHSSPEDKFLVPDCGYSWLWHRVVEWVSFISWGQILSPGLGGIQPGHIHRLAGRYDNPMPGSTISLSQGLRIWPQDMTLTHLNLGHLLLPSPPPPPNPSSLANKTTFSLSVT